MDQKGSSENPFLFQYLSSNPSLKRLVSLHSPADADPSVSMSTNLDQLTADAMKLQLRDSVQLAQRLVSTLDDEVEGDTEALWFAEADRRLEELRSGKVQGVSAEDSFRNARQALKL